MCVMFLCKIIYCMLVVIQPIYGTTTLDANLTANFFKTKSLHFGYIFDCFSIKEKVKFTKFLMSNQLRVSQNNIDQFSYVLSETLYMFSNHIGIIVDGDCNDINNLFKQAEQLQLFDDTHHWLVISSNENALNLLYNITLNINVDLHLATPNKINNNENWAITDVYNPAHKHGGTLKIKNLGFYTQRKGYPAKSKENKYWLRRNMSEVTFKSWIVIRQPFQGSLYEFLESDNNRRIESFNRFQYRVTSYCKKIYNFSWEVNMTNSWGYPVSKHKFDGMVGALQRKEIDFGSSAIHPTAERMPFLEFGRGIWPIRSVFIFRHPTTRSFGQIFLHPMSPSVWLSTLFVGVLIVLILKFIQKHENNILKSLVNSVDHTWTTVLLFVLGTFCQQGYSQSSTLLSARMTTIFVLLFCLLFYQFYSGSIVSNLLTKAPITIKTLKDLLDSFLRAGSEDVPYIKDYFRRTTDPTVVEFFRKKFLEKGNNSSYYAVKDGLKLVEKGGFAYQVEITAAYPIIQNTFSDEAICELGEVKMFPVGIIMVPLQKNSPFRDMLNYCFQRLVEHGIGDRQKKFWSPLKLQCLETSHSKSFHVGLKEIYPALALLIVGMLLSLTIFGFETLVKMRNKQRNKRKVSNFIYIN